MRQMKDVLKNKLDTFAENRSTISKEFVFQNDELSTAAALVFTNAGKSPDIEKIKECRKRADYSIKNQLAPSINF